MNNDLERIWKEMVVVLSQNLPGMTEESMKTLSQDSQSMGQDSNMGPLKYEGVLPLN
jgi:hypothetical protein